MKRMYAVLLVFCFVLFLATPMASADSWPEPEPFSIFSDDGSRVFHVTPESEWVQEQWPDLPQSGLYYNTDPLTPIYLIENPCRMLWEQDFIFSDDMQYFAWIPQMNAERHNFETSNAIALVFYANGVRQESYMVSDLIRNENTVNFSVSTAQWIHSLHPEMRRAVSLDTENNHLSVETVERQTFVFDMTNGTMIAGSNHLSVERVERVPFVFDITNDTMVTESTGQISTLQVTAIIGGGITLFVFGMIFLRKRKQEQ